MSVRTDIEGAVSEQTIAVSEGSADPCKKLGSSEWFCNIIISAQIKSRNLFPFGSAGGNNDDRSTCPCTDVPDKEG